MRPTATSTSSLASPTWLARASCEPPPRAGFAGQGDRGDGRIQQGGLQPDMGLYSARARRRCITSRASSRPNSAPRPSGVNAVAPGLVRAGAPGRLGGRGTDDPGAQPAATPRRGRRYREHRRLPHRRALVVDDGPDSRGGWGRVRPARPPGRRPHFGFADGGAAVTTRVVVGDRIDRPGVPAPRHRPSEARTRWPQGPQSEGQGATRATWCPPSAPASPRPIRSATSWRWTPTLVLHVPSTASRPTARRGPLPTTSGKNVITT